jgi:hypothetical protein
MDAYFAWTGCENLLLDDFIDLCWAKEHESIPIEFASNFTMEAPR